MNLPKNNTFDVRFGVTAGIAGAAAVAIMGGMASSVARIMTLIIVVNLLGAMLISRVLDVDAGIIWGVLIGVLGSLIFGIGVGLGFVAVVILTITTRKSYNDLSWLRVLIITSGLLGMILLRASTQTTTININTLFMSALLTSFIFITYLTFIAGVHLLVDRVVIQQRIPLLSSLLFLSTIASYIVLMWLCYWGGYQISVPPQLDLFHFFLK